METGDDNKLTLEAEAFDHQIRERVEAGHIPDLRRAPECPYFYNNTWRHPDYVRLDFGEQFELVLDAVRTACLSENQEQPRVLEVGCGPGYISLELARNGVDTTGLDLSPVCIDIARRFADEDPWAQERGPLRYVCGDFFDAGLLGPQLFDAVIFVGALHHFPDQERVGDRVRKVLKDNGVIIVHEPTRDRMTMGNAAFIHLVRVLLSVGSGYFSHYSIPSGKEEQANEIARIFTEMRYEGERGENLQSVNDNEAGFKEMNEMLQKRFVQLRYQDRYAFFHELIGGLRFEQQINSQLARYLRDMDSELCRLGVLQPTEFLYVGRRKLD
jgi:2-polyprenyl-3-methyl-5-hydroxy-6-metoxy-1,4-benzoquinol methylase